jgi:DNA-binding response OmpR family regulator
LLIENDESLTVMAVMAVEYLAQNGFGVVHALDAQSGLVRLQTTDFDLVIMI